MITDREIKIKSKKKYKLFLQSILNEENIFPLLIVGDRKPSNTLSVYRLELENLINNSKEKKGFGYSVDLIKKKTKTLGIQSFPSKIYFDSNTDFIEFLRKGKEVNDFKVVSKSIIDEFPELKDWMIRNPLKISSNLPIIEDIIKVCRYFKKNPKPELYIRELPIKVHTKFIETNKGVLKELLDIIITNSLNAEESRFEKRFHLKYDEPIIRFKILDIEICESLFNGLSDMSIPLSQFRELKLPLKRAIIVENKTNLLTTALTLPEQKNTITIFGKGFQVSNLKDVNWLLYLDIVYWGDIDAHGFEILSQVRGYFPRTKSLLMDEVTFDKFYEGDKGSLSNVATTLNLKEEELALYKRIKNNNYRLEQEKIPLEYVKNMFEEICDL